jgi:hypothetical protein
MLVGRGRCVLYSIIPDDADIVGQDLTDNVNVMANNVRISFCVACQLYSDTRLVY